MYEKISSLFTDLWKFQIVTIDKNSITFGTIIIGILFLVVGFTISKYFTRRIVNKWIRKLHIEESYKYTLEVIVYYLFLIISTLFALKMANIPITIFTVLGGAFAIGIGFGSQNIINNFISGIILMIERPIKVGDFVELDGTFGKVQEIGMRSTFIHSLGNKHIIVPNSFFLEKSVINWTYENKSVRVKLSVGVAYGSDTRLVEKIIMKVIKDNNKILNTPTPEIFFSDFGDNALGFDSYFSVPMRDMLDRERIESNVRHEIYEAFNKENIVIAFPQRDLHFIQQKPFQVEVNQKS